MATRYTFISLGPAAMQILEMDRKLRRSESAKRAANKRLQTWLAQQVYEGNYEEYDGGVYMVEGSHGRLYDVTDQVEAQLAYDEDEDFSLDDITMEDLMDEEDEEDYTDEDDDYESHRRNLLQAVYEKTLQYLFDYTPVDTGNLIESLYANNDGYTVIIGFDMHTAPYAVYQHENMALAHSNGTAKFLQNAVLEAVTVVDQQRELNVNITINPLHQGGKLEAQISFDGPDNLGAALAEKTEDSDFMRAAQKEFNHDFAADVNNFYKYSDLFSEVGDAGLLDTDLLSNIVRNRRMNMRALNKVTEEELAQLLSKNVAAGNAGYATTALGAIMLKKRFNYKKALFKMKNAHNAGVYL